MLIIRAHLPRIWRSELRARVMELGGIAQPRGSDTNALREEKWEGEHGKSLLHIQLTLQQDRTYSRGNTKPLEGGKPAALGARCRV